MPDLLAKAIEIAARAHAGQVDKLGEPYILHAVYVMMNVTAYGGRQDPTQLRCAAVLHDVVEDSGPHWLTVMDEAGIHPDVVEAVICLTRAKGEKYNAYIRRVAANPIARMVKFADIEHNTLPPRLFGLPRHVADSLCAKYQRATAYLSTHGQEE